VAWWIAALVAGAAPRRIWARLDPPLPLARTAAPAGILTLTLGFIVGLRGFFAYARMLAGANNDWMLRQLALPPQHYDAAVGLVPYAISPLTLFIFLFFTPTGLAAVYLVASGTIRAVAAVIDPEDPRGDFVLSAIDRAWTTARRRATASRARAARERLEGEERPDVLQTGASLGVAADYVVLASRRKAEWNAGAIVMTSTDWYKLGAPFDIDTPFGLRTAYPLTRMDAVEVVRRGIHYELPDRAARPPRGS
jgi:hypothetical protein